MNGRMALLDAEIAFFQALASTALARVSRGLSDNCTHCTVYKCWWSTCTMQADQSRSPVEKCSCK